MEWVETTARTVHEAKELALDQLGVAEDDAEFEILEEPRAGLFGRTRGEARVRARVRPAQVRQKVERRDRKRSRPDRPAAASGSKSAGQTTNGVTDGAEAAGDERPPATRSRAAAAPKARATKAASSPQTDDEAKEHQVDAAQVGEQARTFMQELVAAFGLEGTTELVEDGDDLEVKVHGANLGLLVGPRGTTLQAVQDLARVASQRRLGDHDTRLRIDVGGYRERRREALGRFAQQVADDVKSSGEPRALEPMSSADRKIIHDALNAIEGIVTHSEGDDPNRRVVIAPANA
jgi:spoIIIJ-associated protein